MDIELRKSLKELLSHVLKTLAKTENVPKSRRCVCANTFKEISV